MPIFEPTRTTSLEEKEAFDKVASPSVQASASSVPAPAVSRVPNVPDISSRGMHRTDININNVHDFHSRFKTQHNIDMDLQYRTRSPIAFLSEMNVDTMYLHQTINQEDIYEFIKTVVKEINGHVDNKRWELVPVEDFPEEEEPLT